MRQFSFMRSVTGITLGLVSLTTFASAQTVINMPAPPKKTPETVAGAPFAPATTGSSAASGTTAYTASASQTVDVGDVALARYAGARYGTYDTYFENGMYDGGIRVYSYPRYFPQFVWGPWWGWGGFGFHNCW